MSKKKRKYALERSKILKMNFRLSAMYITITAQKMGGKYSQSGIISFHNIEVEFHCDIYGGII